MAQSGSAHGWGSWGREFESRRPDHEIILGKVKPTFLGVGFWSGTTDILIGFRLIRFRLERVRVIALRAFSIRSDPNLFT